MAEENRNKSFSDYLVNKEKERDLEVIQATSPYYQKNL